MPEEKPRLGPWLRHYGQREQRSRRERLVELSLGAGAAVGFLIVLAGVLWAFTRFPVPTLIGLVAVWLVGFVVLAAKRQRAAARERALREAQLSDRPYRGNDREGERT